MLYCFFSWPNFIFGGERRGGGERGKEQDRRATGKYRSLLYE